MRFETDFQRLVERAPIGLAHLDPLLDTDGEIVDFAFRYVNALGVETGWPNVEDVGQRQAGEPHLGAAGSETPGQEGMVAALRQVVRTGQRWTAGGYELPARSGSRGGERLDPLVLDVFGSKVDSGIVLAWHETTAPALPGRQEDAPPDAEPGEELDRWNDILVVLRHELMTPLNTIVGFCELLEHGIWGGLNEQQNDQVARIRRSTDHMASLVKESLVPRGLRQITRTRVESVDAVEVLGDVVALMTPAAERNGLGLRLNGPKGPVTMRTDSGKFRQILTNLVGNALKYTEEGRVEVSLEATDPEWVVIRVRDTGPGIPEASRERVFQPYVRLEAEERPRTGGSGVGLPVSRRLARLLGGDVSLEEADVGRGSTFLVRLPRAIGGTRPGATERGRHSINSG